jgi:hypothetical protein
MSPSAALLLLATLGVAQPPEIQSALDDVEAAIRAGQTAKAEAGLRPMLKLRLKPGLLCRALDLQGQLHVFSSRYFQGMEAMRKAVSLGKCSLTSAGHPVPEVAKLHQCARAASDAGISGPSFEELVRAALHIYPTEDVDKYLLDAVEAGTWTCPVTASQAPVASQTPVTAPQAPVASQSPVTASPPPLTPPAPNPPPPVALAPLPVKPPEWSASAPGIDTEGGANDSSVSGYVLVGAGTAVVSSAVATTLGVLALSRSSRAHSDVSEYNDNIDSARDYALGANIAWAAAGSAAVVTMLLWLLDDGPEDRDSSQGRPAPEPETLVH